ncbi:hypothetical protein EB796_018589 [Bugula neritina]|uniref:Uncharacterized protein n=1 Tax=Bugula neritina TaxID=10212 RepID=A0A7J7JA45_BUGNE|nr:hypothetical protein EB796_018589 [Bugula neritina]
MEKTEHSNEATSNVAIEVVDGTASSGCESDTGTELGDESLTSLDSACDQTIHQLSIINILEISSSSDSAVSSADIESEQEEAMSNAMSSISSSGSQLEKTVRIQS